MINEHRELLHEVTNKVALGLSTSAVEGLRLGMTRTQFVALAEAAWKGALKRAEADGAAPLAMQPRNVRRRAKQRKRGASNYR